MIFKPLPCAASSRCHTILNHFSLIVNTFFYLFCFLFTINQKTLFAQIVLANFNKSLICLLYKRTQFNSNNKIIKKRASQKNQLFFTWCGRRDLNPYPERLAPKTSASAIPPRPPTNSDTIITFFSYLVNTFF